MERFFTRLHHRREHGKRVEKLRRHHWADDEESVRTGSCDFVVKYLGSVGVTESKGTHVIKDSIHVLKYGTNGPDISLSPCFKKSWSPENYPQYGTLQINGDGIVFVRSLSEDVLVEAAVDRISFCGPVEHGKYFGFICRQNDGWKWFCHVFQTIDDHAERLNNAVGCAFHANLEKRHRERTAREARSSAAEGVYEAAEGIQARRTASPPGGISSSPFDQSRLSAGPVWETHRKQQNVSQF